MNSKLTIQLSNEFHMDKMKSSPKVPAISLKSMSKQGKKRLSQIPFHADFMQVNGRIDHILFYFYLFFNFFFYSWLCEHL